MASSQQRRRPKPWYRRITRERALLAALAAVVLLLLLFGWQAMRASSSLRLAASQAELLQNQIVAGDDAGAKATLGRLQESADRAKGTTDGLMWDIGSRVPLVGKNVKAVQTVSEVIDQVATEALPPVVALSKQINLDTFSPKDGRVDLAAVKKISPSIITADRALQRAERKLDGIDAQSLLVPLRGPVGAIQFKIGNAASASSNSVLAARLLPSMLGEGTTRRYLLLIQNNAEVRSTGGISGSFAMLKAKNGKLSMGFQGSYADLVQSPEPVVAMTTSEKTLFPATLATNILDVNVTPDFPRSGEIARALVKKVRDEDVDGVISVDPVAMSFILRATGPVQTDLPGFVLNEVNAVDLLLNTTYLKLGLQQQDDAFEIAARTVFDVITQGKADARLVIGGLVQGVAENRVMVWSSRAEEQALIGPSALSGALKGDDGSTPHVGMYLGDAASGKMEYYLDYATSVAAGRCLPGDIQEISTSTSLTSTAPSNAARLAESVVGTGKYTPKGTMKLIARFYAPFGGGFTSVKLNNVPQTIYADQQKGRNVTKVLLTIKPGETQTITTTMITGKGQDGDAVFSTTPGVRSTQNDVEVKSACQ